MTPAKEDLQVLRRAAAEMFFRAEMLRDQADLEGAARLFGRAAGTWRTTGDAMEAADAYIELGGVLLRQGRGQVLPDLAVRVENLVAIDPLPEGAYLNLRVFSALIARGVQEKDAFLGLVQERRLGRHRHTLARDTERPGTPERDFPG